jgi:hypothetical protein
MQASCLGSLYDLLLRAAGLDRVNQLLDIGRPLGRFSMVNNCRSFAFDVLIHSRNGYRPLPDPHPAMIRVLRTGGRGRDL